jgi:FkbM family methyltransferase
MSGVSEKFFPTQVITKSMVQTITSVELSLGAPFGPRAQQWTVIPDYLNMCVPEATTAELEFASSLRAKFQVPGYEDPYLADVVRAFRCISGSQVYLEVGIFDRGNLAYIANLLPDGATLIGVDIQADAERDALLRAHMKPNQTFIPIIGDSRLPETVESVRRALCGRKLDAIFIDGDHTAYGAMCDYVNYGVMVRGGGLILFHDCLWEGNETYKGCAHAINEISKIEETFIVPGYGACQRFMMPLFRDEIWGTVAVVKVSDSSDVGPKPTREEVAPVPSASVFFEGQDWKAKLAFDSIQSFLMEHLTRKLETVSFIQVGANDGSHADPINPFVTSGRWRGILIEPLPSTFKRLKENYQNLEGLTFVNVAVGAEDSEAVFYSVQDPHSALSSFSRDNVAKHRHWLPNVLDLVDEISVPVKRLDTILAEHRISDFDVLVVDAEGFDDVVIASVDLDSHRPKMIMFEHVHLTGPGSADLMAQLSGAGYSLIYDGYDCIAVRNGSIDDYVVQMAMDVIRAAK